MEAREKKEEFNMDPSQIGRFFLWCALINYGLLLLWFAIFAYARNWVFHIHSRWIKVSDEHFDAIHYAGMMTYKLAIFLFCLAPWLATLILF